MSDSGRMMRSAAKPPNIILVFVDNQPADMLGCAGNEEIQTPHLDRLAAQGVRFGQAFCPNTMCSPCRASVLTGLMPSQHGVHTWLDDSLIGEWPENWSAIEEFDALPTLLSRAGYDTALVGKYHLGRVDRPQNGFREWVTMAIGHVQSFYGNAIVDNGREYTVPGHTVEFFTDQAVAYLRRAVDFRAPFFLFLTYPAPYGHWPAIKGDITNQFAETYRAMPMSSVPREGVSRELIEWIILRHKIAPGEWEEDYKSMAQMPNDLPTLRNYYSQMSMVDLGVGRVLEELDALQLVNNTLVVYTSDHGMSLGQHGFWGHGEDTWPANTYREATNVPLIVRPPNRVEPGPVSSSLVGTTDIFATILDYAGVDRRDGSQPRSRSFRPLLEGASVDWDNAVFMEQEETRSIRTVSWLLMKRFRGSSYEFNDELYDLADDPSERNNLAGHPDHAGVLSELSKRLDRFFADTADPRWDLWNGGTVKSNSSRPFLWKDAWGPGWSPAYDPGDD